MQDIWMIWWCWHRLHAKLRKAIKITYQALKPWGYQLHTNEKTFIGKIAKGFDFCGLRLKL